MPETTGLLAGGVLFPLLAALAALEGWFRQRRGRGYDWNEYRLSVIDAIGRIAIGAVLRAGVAGVALYAAWNARLHTFAMDVVWHWIALFLGVELCYYWMHRADHRVRWLWLTHSVHHSSNTYTLAAALRLGWTGRISGAAVFFAPLVWVGFHPALVVAALALNLLYQFWLHTELIGRLGPLEWVLNTPSHHRVHHASNPGYLDCNYGGVLIVFDRLFGTFRREAAGVPIRYGLTTPLATRNPLRVALHAWIDWIADLRRARGLRDALRITFAAPGAASAARGPARRGGASSV